ncbi:MAG TPA: PH domain-containing protein [Chitinophagales bacterium]|nr:PH domain-containing protein [Chitinophagales bacterium]
MEYKASLDALSKGLTAGVFILLIVIGYRSIKALMIAHGDMTTVLIHSGTLLFLVALLVGSYIYSPQKYILTGDSLIIKRLIGNVVIPLDDIVEARTVQDSEMTSTVRTFGNGGLFGYYGKYHSPRLGHMTFYTTKRDNRVLIKTKDGKNIVLTPDDKNLLINEIKSMSAAGR